MKNTTKKSAKQSPYGMAFGTRNRRHSVSEIIDIVNKECDFLVKFGYLEIFSDDEVDAIFVKLTPIARTLSQAILTSHNFYAVERKISKILES